MICPDVNVLIYAHREDAPEHGAYATWLRDLVHHPQPFALSELVLSAVIRIVTNRRAFSEPTSLSLAVGFVEGLRARRNARVVRPGERHWSTFVELCNASKASGKLVADAYHAAIAIEHGLTWATADSDFARFPLLNWRHLLRP